jgi:hypothetical protein
MLLQWTVINDILLIIAANKFHYSSINMYQSSQLFHIGVNHFSETTHEYKFQTHGTYTL